jgi:hypothetical protein
LRAFLHGLSRSARPHAPASSEAAGSLTPGTHPPDLGAPTPRPSKAYSLRRQRYCDGQPRGNVQRRSFCVVLTPRPARHTAFGHSVPRWAVQERTQGESLARGQQLQPVLDVSR